MHQNDPNGKDMQMASEMVTYGQGDLPDLANDTDGYGVDVTDATGKVHSFGENGEGELVSHCGLLMETVRADAPEDPSCLTCAALRRQRGYS